MIGSKKIIVQISAATDIGNVRQTNQDNLYLMKPVLDYSKLEHFSSADLCGAPVLAAVCDGMGGGMLGERASYLAVARLSQINPKELQKLKKKDLIETLKQLFFEINHAIYVEYGVLGTLTGSTMTLIYIDDQRVAVLNVGDSPCVRFDAKGYQIVSHLDNCANLMYEKGQITEAERWTHKTRNHLSQFLGMNPAMRQIEPFVYYEKKIKKNTYYLLCSDGLIDGIQMDKIAGILGQDYRPDVARRIVEQSLQGGTRDNVTALLINVQNKHVDL